MRSLAQKDAEAFEKALVPLRKEFGANVQAKGFFQDMENKLTKLKAESKK